MVNEVETNGKKNKKLKSIKQWKYINNVNKRN